MADLNRLAEIEDTETAVAIGLVQDDGSARAVGAYGGTRRPEHHIAVGSGKLTRGVEVEDAAAAAETIPESGIGCGGEAGTIGDERPAGQRAGEVGRSGLGDAGHRIRAADATQESGATTQGAEVGAEVISDRLDTQHAAERTPVGIECHRGRGTDITQRKGTQT